MTGALMNLEELPLWSWWILACGLIVAEIATTTFTFMFFAVAAILVGLAQVMGLRGVAAELVLFGLLGLALLVLFRKALLSRFKSPESRWGANPDVARIFKLTHAVPPRGEAQAEYQGTTWTVVNDSDETLAKGQEVIIQRTAGIRLVVRPKV